MAVDLKKQVIDLSKKAQSEIRSRGLTGLSARVILVLDISKSMNRLYKSGVMQQVVERITALALNFDDDGTVDVILFGTHAYRLPGVTPDTLESYVEREILSTYKVIEATQYATALAMIDAHYDAVQTDPVFVIFITDGNNSDKTETTERIRALSKKPIFIQFVGIGKEDFPYLKKLDDLDGRAVDNAGFTHINDIATVSDGALYARLLNEFPKWIIDAKAVGILRG